MAQKTMQVSIVSHEGEIYNGKATMFYAKGADGDIGIAPGHLQLLTSIAPGAVRVEKPDGEEELLYVSGGILEVQPSQVTILADQIERPVDVNETLAKKAKEEAEKMLAARKAGSDEYREAQMDLAEAMAKLRVLEIVRLRKGRTH